MRDRAAGSAASSTAPAGQPASGDGRDLPDGRRHGQGAAAPPASASAARGAVRAQRPAPCPTRPAPPRPRPPPSSPCTAPPAASSAQCRDAVGEQDQRDRRRQREPAARPPAPRAIPRAPSRAPCRPGCWPGPAGTGTGPPGRSSCARRASGGARRTRRGSSPGARPARRRRSAPGAGTPATLPRRCRRLSGGQRGRARFQQELSRRPPGREFTPVIASKFKRVKCLLWATSLLGPVLAASGGPRNQQRPSTGPLTGAEEGRRTAPPAIQRTSRSSRRLAAGERFGDPPGLATTAARPGFAVRAAVFRGFRHGAAALGGGGAPAGAAAEPEVLRGQAESLHLGLDVLDGLLGLALAQFFCLRQQFLACAFD